MPLTVAIVPPKLNLEEPARTPRQPRLFEADMEHPPGAVGRCVNNDKRELTHVYSREDRLILGLKILSLTVYQRKLAMQRQRRFTSEVVYASGVPSIPLRWRATTSRVRRCVVSIEGKLTLLPGVLAQSLVPGLLTVHLFSPAAKEILLGVQS